MAPLNSMMNILSPPGARGSPYIVPSGERGPLDQTDIDWTIVLDPLGWWSVIPKESPDWTLEGAGALVPRAGALGQAPFCLRFILVASGVF